MDNALCELEKRSGRIRARRSRRVLHELCLSVIVLTFALLASVSAVMPAPGAAPPESVFGAALLPVDAGGYILVAVLSFAAAVLLTLLLLRHAEKKRADRENKKDQ